MNIETEKAWEEFCRLTQTDPDNVCTRLVLDSVTHDRLKSAFVKFVTERDDRWQMAIGMSLESAEKLAATGG